MCFPDTYFPFGGGDELQPYITARSTWSMWEHTTFIKKGLKNIDPGSKYAMIPDHRLKPRAPQRGAGFVAWSSYFLEKVNYNLIPTYLERLPDPIVPMDTLEAAVEAMEVDD